MKLIVVAVAGLMAVGGHAYAQEEAAGAAVFRKCMACHQVGPNARNGVGPVLNGARTLTRYLRAPREVVPGTKMAFAGLKDNQDIADVIAYLKQFDEQGQKVH